MSVSPRRVVFALVALLAAAPALSQVPQSALPSRNLLDQFGLERAWSNQSTIDVRSDVVLHLVADEEVVIVQSRSGMLTVFDAQSGIKLWDGQLARPDQYSYPASTNADSLFIVIGSTVYARNKFNGENLWTLRLPSVPSTSPTVDAERMYVGTLTGDVYAFDLASIARNQAEGRLPQYRNETIAWRYATSGQIVGPPVTDGKIVCFANSLASIYAVSPERKLRFQFEVNQPATAPMDMGTGMENGVEVGFLYVPTGDTTLYCLRATNGTTRWLYLAGSPIRQKPYLIGDVVYLVPVDAGMYSLSEDTGHVRWWAPSVTQFIAATPTRAYGTDKAGNIAVLDRSNGGLLGTVPMPGFPIRVPNERTDRMYLCSTSGLVTCIREKGAELPIYHRFPERRPIVPLFPGQPPVEEPVEPAETPSEPEAPAP